jgi:hypothetical protein
VDDDTTVPHLCHARCCKTPVPPARLMCPKHWRVVPSSIRRDVWAHYRPGQEVDKRPTSRYLEVAQEAINAVADYEGTRRQPCG